MTYEEFSARARQIFEDIPPEYKRGVDGLEVTRKTVLHPTLPEVYTLGECLSESYPSEFGGPGEVRSLVALYYGSFLAVARGEEDWDWEDEIWETITHEIKHHLEHLASEDALEEMDYAEDQNFARREGESFDTFYYQTGELIEPGVYAIDGDLFVETRVATRHAQSGESLAVEVLGRRLQVPLPSEVGDVTFLRVLEPPLDLDGEFFVVVVRKRGAAGWLRGLLGSTPLAVKQSDVNVELEERA